MVAVVAVALALRVAAVLLVEVDPRARWSFDMSWYDGVAKRLVAGWGYVGFDWAPTAHWPPGYPLLLAGVYWLFGPSLLAAKLTNALLATATVFLTRRIGCELGRPRVGLAAAGLYQMYRNDRGAYPWVEDGLQKLLRPERRRWLDAVVDAYYLSVLVLALFGTRHFLTADRGAVLLPIGVAWFTLMHAVLFFGNARFHHPLLPVLALMAAAELLAWTGRVRAATTGKE